ncbi:MAG: HDIG domain-containing protein [Paludibacter sp.]|jgi:putative nucleotidyltransferase with HDIG domain|nr:HDIG domain-containing protein [Paludibacter sp.]
MKKSLFWQKFYISLLFVVVVCCLVLFAPKDSAFNYTFEKNRPWTHGLITADFDFPVYKDKEQIEDEKKVLLKSFLPYFTFDTAVAKAQTATLFAEHDTDSALITYYHKLLNDKFLQVYARGIIAADMYEDLQRRQVQLIRCIMPDRVVQTLSLSDVYTPKSAYRAIMRNAPLEFQDYNLNWYLVDNLKYDSVASENEKTEMLKQLSLTSGMIQQGEKIIERGDIITPELFRTLSSLKTESDKRTVARSVWVTAGEVIAITGIVLLFFLYLHLFRPRIFESYRNLLFINLLLMMIVGLAALIIKTDTFHYYIVPYALLPVIIRVFYDSRTALFANICAVMIISFMIDNPFQFIILQITAGMVAVSSLKDMTQRSQLAQTALYILLTYVAMFLASELIVERSIKTVDFHEIAYFAVSCFLLLLAYLLIFIFEKIFGLISAITLVELTNVNSDLMMRFAEAAPGTFQHSLQASNLATEAAKKIGANSLLVRTGALYHDIGKMEHPQYFVENQMGGNNPLLELGYEQAAQTVIRHVADGVAIAKKNHLPQQIINFIETHHGKGKTKFFYNAFINANPHVPPNDAAFTYNGTLPNSKETAILMMADAVEARLRTLPEYTNETISESIENMIDTQIAEGQFKDAPISFRDVEIVKSVFKEKIKNIYHTRIAYPEVNK